jgi:hypothetical protein
MDDQGAYIVETAIEGPIPPAHTENRWFDGRRMTGRPQCTRKAWWAKFD